MRIEITGHVQQVTTDAVCVQVHTVGPDSTPNQGDTWFPRAQCSPHNFTTGTKTAFTIPQWLVSRKGLAPT